MIVSAGVLEHCVVAARSYIGEDLGDHPIDALVLSIVEGEQIRVFPPDEFLAVLERLNTSLEQPGGGDLSV